MWPSHPRRILPPSSNRCRCILLRYRGGRMAFTNSADLIRRFDAAEENLCVAFNRWSQRRAIRIVFAAVSRLGNGVFWYTLILGLPVLFGMYGAMRTLQLTITGFAGVAIYKLLKNRFV